jgi:hypothetical protein
MGAATFTLDSQDRTVKVLKSPRGIVASLGGEMFFRYDRMSDTVRIWPTANKGLTYRIALRRIFSLTGLPYGVMRRTNRAGVLENRVFRQGESWDKRTIKPGLKLRPSDTLRGLELPAGASAA